MIEKFRLERIRYLIEYFFEKVILYHTTSNLLYSSNLINSNNALLSLKKAHKKKDYPSSKNINFLK